MWELRVETTLVAVGLELDKTRVVRQATAVGRKWRLHMDAIWIPTMPVRRCIGSVLGAVLLLVGACAGVQTDRQLVRERVNGYIAAHPDLDPKVADAIRNLDLAEGMTPDQVTVVRGKPAIVEKSRSTELWYFSCEYPNVCTSFGGRGRRGGSQEVRKLSRAFFVNGKLKEWQN